MVRLSPQHCLACVAALVVGCATGSAGRPLHPDHLPGIWHVIEQGETSVALAKQAGIPIEDFLEINGLRRNEPLVPGHLVFLLGARARPNQSESSRAGEVVTTAPAPATERPSSSNAPLRWPVASPKLSSPFGKRWGKEHDGIDMAAPIGTPVFAAAAGTVIYAGDQVRGYGNMIVIKHSEDLATVYAHNSVLLAHAGDRVSVGQEIARVGDTGRSTAPHLHFEVRRKEIPQDPMLFLPPLK